MYKFYLPSRSTDCSSCENESDWAEGDGQSVCIYKDGRFHVNHRFCNEAIGRWVEPTALIKCTRTRQNSGDTHRRRDSHHLSFFTATIRVTVCCPSFESYMIWYVPRVLMRPLSSRNLRLRKRQLNTKTMELMSSKANALVAS